MLNFFLLLIIFIELMWLLALLTRVFGFSFGFIEFMGEEDADYAIKIMNMIKLYGKPIKVVDIIFENPLEIC